MHEDALQVDGVDLHAPERLAGRADDRRDPRESPSGALHEDARRVLTPLDLERTYGLTGGNIFQGEMSLDQMYFLRPAAGWARYATPLRNLYLCGSGTHPGGGVMGAPGYNAARIILRDWRKIGGS